MSPIGPDPLVIERHLMALEKNLTNLKRHQGRSLELFRGDLDEQSIVERGLLLCAQGALDVATHLSASAGRDTADYAAALDALGDLGILPAEFVRRFRGVAGFRNVLVHQYTELDLARVHALLNEHLEDFEQFIAYVRAHLG